MSNQASDYLKTLLHYSNTVICSPFLLIQEEAKKSSQGRAELEQQLASSTSTVAILQTEKEKLQTEVQESKKEQDDLLMLLADQDQKIHALKKKLKDLGEPVNRHHSGFPPERRLASSSVCHVNSSREI